MPTNFLSFDTPTTPAQIERRKAMATALKVKQPVKHPLQAIDNAVGDLTGAFLDRQAAQGEDARRKALADALQGIAPGGLDPKVYGALIENDPESAMKIVAQSQMGAAQQQQEAATEQAHYDRNRRDAVADRDFAAAQKDNGSTFEGNGLDAQAWNILQTADPASKEYATAYAIISQPKTQYVQTADGLVPTEVPPTLPAWLQPPGGPAPEASPAQPPLPKIGSPDEPMPPGAPADPAATPAGAPAPAAPPPMPAAAAPAASPPAGSVIPPVVVPPPPPAAPAPNQGVKVGAPIPGTGQKPTDTQRNRVSQVNQALAAVNTGLDRYAELVDKTGIAAVPGNEKDNLNTVRQGVMLQMKELFNLGVLNGPDLQLMEKMIYDPVVDPMKEGGAANLPGQAMTAMGIGGSAGDRAKNSVAELKAMLAGIAGSVNNQTPGGATQPPPGDIPSSVPGVTIRRK